MTASCAKRLVIVLTIVLSSLSPDVSADETPHDLLATGNESKAIAKMKFNPKWVHRRDEYQRTPLYMAALHGRKRAVEWLLENGASVQKGPYDKSTPLHAATDPAVVELLMKGKHDLEQENEQGETVLQLATHRLVHWRGKEQLAQKKIVDLLLAAGADVNLIAAIHLDDLDRLKAILQKHPNQADDYRGRSLLRVAAGLGRLGICRYLIENHKVDVDDFERGNGYPIIKDAVGSPDVVKLLIASGADLKKRISWRAGASGIQLIGDEATALHFAADDVGHPASVRLLLDAGVKPMAAANPDQTALEVAAASGQAASASAIINHEAFQRVGKKRRQSVINKALLCGSFVPTNTRTGNYHALISVLLSAGADSNVVGDDGLTAMQQVASCTWPEQEKQNERIRKIVRTLVEHGAVLDIYSAVSVNDQEGVRKLLKESGPCNLRYGEEGRSLLHIATINNYKSVVELLLDAGCDVNIMSRYEGMDSETALHTAASFGRPEVARVLIAGGANVGAKDGDGATPLHVAAHGADAIMVKLLLDAGADVAARNDRGETPRKAALRSFGDSSAAQKVLLDFERSKR